MSNEGNRLDPAEGETLIPHLEFGEEVEVKGKRYRVVDSGKVDVRAFEPIATLKAL